MSNRSAGAARQSAHFIKSYHQQRSTRHWNTLAERTSINDVSRTVSLCFCFICFPTETRNENPQSSFSLVNSSLSPLFALVIGAWTRTKCLQWAGLNSAKRHETPEFTSSARFIHPPSLHNGHHTRTHTYIHQGIRSP